jgi:hypothetical protein
MMRIDGQPVDQSDIFCNVAQVDSVVTVYDDAAR